jgi:putative ABC transport system substrate-binding protein
MLGSGANPDPDQFITDIPAVFAVVSQPTKTGLVPNFESSGRNITGTTYLVPMPTQISLIQSYRPLHKLGMIYNPLEKNSLLTLDEINSLTAKMDFSLVAEPVDVVDNHPDASSIRAKLEAMRKAGIDFLYIPPDTFLNLNRDALTAACLELGIPTFAAAENPVLTSKAMFGGVYRYYTVGQMTAYKATQILLQNVPPKDIPVDAPKRLSIILNMPVVRQLALYPPMKVLQLAEIIDTNSGP